MKTHFKVGEPVEYPSSTGIHSYAIVIEVGVKSGTMRGCYLWNNIVGKFWIEDSSVIPILPNLKEIALRDAAINYCASQDRNFYALKQAVADYLETKRMTVERLAVMDTSHLQDWVNGNTNNSGRCTYTTTLATTLI